MYVYVYVCVYVYISLSIYLSLSLYIYIYIYSCVHYADKVDPPQIHSGSQAPATLDYTTPH